MGFIRWRKIKYDNDGKIVSGSAAIIDVKYIPGDVAYHAKQETREKLGKVIIKESNSKGLFQSPTRGLVWYDSEKDTFSAEVTKEDAQSDQSLKDHSNVEELFPDPEIHTVFGDGYLFLEILKASKLLKVLKDAFPEKIFFERLLCHLAYTILRDGSHISCDDFINKSFLSYCCPDISIPSLKSDTAYFTMMGDDKFKVAYFKAFVELKRKTNPNFGKSCFIDSTPLPNDIDSPFTALCSHGVESTSTQMRLALILDATDLDVIWYTIIPGNVLDFNTVNDIKKDVKSTLKIDINAMVVDAGYVSKELVQSYTIQKEGEPVPEKHYLARMPAKNGYPHKMLYTEMKHFFYKPKYEFVRGKHLFFGKEKEVTIFDTKVMVYVYLDYYNSLSKFTSYLTEHEDEYLKLTYKAQEEKKDKFGFFILISNYRKTPAKMLDDYYERTNIEDVIKNDKEYLMLLPLAKWTDRTVRGKILSDIIDDAIRKRFMSMRKKKEDSLPGIIGKAQSLMCCYNCSTRKVHVDTASRQVKEIMKIYGFPVIKELDMDAYLKTIYDVEKQANEPTQA